MFAASFKCLVDLQQDLLQVDWNQVQENGTSGDWFESEYLYWFDDNGHAKNYDIST